MMSSSPPPANQTPFKDHNVTVSSSPLLDETLTLQSVHEYSFLHRPHMGSDQEFGHEQPASASAPSAVHEGLLDFVPISSQEDPALQYPAYMHPLTESYSSSTVSSVHTENPIPSSVSNGSLSNVHRTPIRRSNSLITPRRPANAGRATDKSPGTGNPFYTPPAFLSPKITKHRKQRSLTTSVSLSHLDTDLQLQMQHNQHGSPLHTPLRTPGRPAVDENEEDDGVEPRDSAGEPCESYFVSPSVLMKKKFGGKLSDLHTLRHETHEVYHMDHLAASGDFINPEFLQKVQDIPLLIDDDNVEALDQQKLMHPPLLRATTLPPPQPKPGRLTRSRSTMNLSEIASYKEAKTAALRSASSFMDDLNFSISEVPEPEHAQAAAPASAPYHYDTPYSHTQVRQYSRFQYLTPPNSSSSSTSGVSSFLGGDNKAEEYKKKLALGSGLKEPERLDRPLQSSRSKSRSKNSEQEKKKTHECPLCHSRFQRPEHVKRHMRSHSSEKPFVCPQEKCGKRFNRNDNLKQHLRKIHHLAI
ncbi:hypothetical protein KL910_000571 [Ogataea haglerorum]|nr:hypothetical protein KL945_003575 [Ogataea haglerorum]KAG7793876.1 hypothetical protein KL910_000571 [Ogataea haglerorum]